MIEVRSNNRTLQFEGVELGFSTSQRADSLRWVEMTLYRTAAGVYVLSRVGRSSVYHRAACRFVKKSDLDPVEQSSLPDKMLACSECRPGPNELVYPEIDRYWAQALETAAAVVDCLHKRSDTGERYLTYVASDLLEEAGEKDQRIYIAYNVETIA